MKKLIVTIALCGLCVGSIQAADLVPASSGLQSLGQTALKWLNGYFINLYTTNLTVATGGTLTVPSGSLTLPANTFVSTITASIAKNANGGTNVVTITGKDLAGTTVTAPFMFRAYITDLRDGALAAVAGDVVVGNGMELQQVVDKADYWIVSTNNLGTAVFTVTDTPGGTNFIHLVGPSGFRTTYTSEFDIP